MKKAWSLLILLMLAVTASGQPATDPRSVRMMGIPIEGPLDSLRQALQAAEFNEWGQSDDGEDYYFRGNFYGFRAKLMNKADGIVFIKCISHGFALLSYPYSSFSRAA